MVKKIAVMIDTKDIWDRIPEEEKEGCSGLMIGNFNTIHKDEVIIECLLFNDLKDTTDDTLWCLFRKRGDIE